MTTETEFLMRLREAARRGDWNGCRDATEALLSRLPAATMLRLAHDELARRLPLFELHHPTMHWPRVWLDALASGEPFTFDESTPEVLEEAPGPGGNSFAEGVRQLALAKAAEGAQCVTHAIAAISRAVMIEKTEAAARDRLEIWDLWFQEGLVADTDTYYWVLLEFTRDPTAAAVGLAAWNRLADELAEALGAQG